MLAGSYVFAFAFRTYSQPPSCPLSQGKMSGKLILIGLLVIATICSSYTHSILHTLISSSKQRHDFGNVAMALGKTETCTGLPVMVNGLPGPMALEVAKVALDRGFKLLPIAFTGPGQPDSITVEGSKSSQVVKLIAGPGIENNNADEALKDLKKEYPNIVIVDYTHPSAVINNLNCYIANDCEIVMGTTGVDNSVIEQVFQKGSNYAVIAPNMAKQIVAMQSALLEMSSRFPGSFGYIHYKLYTHYTPLYTTINTIHHYTPLYTTINTI